VAAGNFDGDTAKEIVVGRGRGVGRVRVFDVDAGKATLLPGTLGSFIAFASGGARVAAGNFDSHSGDEVIVGTTNSGRVKVFASDGQTRPLISFMAGLAKDGVHVAAVDLDGNGFADIVAGSRGRIRIFEDMTAHANGEVVVYDSPRSSVRVGVADRNGDGTADTILTATGPGTAGPLIKRFDALTLQQIDEFFAYGPNGGAFVAG
jgi:hypothetical protein